MIYWIAHYIDGSNLRQYNNGVTNSYQDIERHRLVAFDLWRDEQLLVRVDLRDNDNSSEIEARRLIYRKRHQMTDKGHHLTFYMVGWQRKVNGRNVQAINYVFEDGGILLGGQFTDEGGLPMHAIAILPYEQDLK